MRHFRTHVNCGQFFFRKFMYLLYFFVKLMLFINKKYYFLIFWDKYYLLNVGLAVVDSRIHSRVWCHGRRCKTWRLTAVRHLLKKLAAWPAKHQVLQRQPRHQIREWILLSIICVWFFISNSRIFTFSYNPLFFSIKQRQIIKSSFSLKTTTW